MRKRTWFRLALGVAALLHTSISGAALSSTWSRVIKGPMARNVVTCTTFRGFADQSVLILQVTRATMRQGVLTVKLMNLNWSIRSSTDLPELKFRDAQGSGLIGVPIAAEHALVFHIPIEPVIEWSDTLQGEPFILMRDSQPLAKFDSTGLVQAIRDVRACGQNI